MASTNKTTHYELSQYLGSDKPTYLGDYNGDMAKIDTQMYQNATNAQLGITNAGTAQDRADSAYTLATTANNTANNALTTAQTADTTSSANTTNIGAMADLTTTDKSSLVDAINEVNALAPIVLYENTTGTVGNVSLSDSAENYSYIEIYYHADSIHYSNKIASPNGSYTTLMAETLASQTPALFCKTKMVGIRDSLITVYDYSQFALNVSGFAYLRVTSEYNTIYIDKVVGYK